MPAEPATVTTADRSAGVAVVLCEHATAVADVHAAVAHEARPVCALGVTFGEAKFRPDTVTLTNVEKGRFALRVLLMTGAANDVAVGFRLNRS